MALPVGMDATTPWPYPQRVLFAALVLALCLVAWLISDVFMLAFGAIVAAAVVRGLARRYEAWTGLSTQKAAMLAALSIALLLAAVFWLVGEALADQLGQLQRSLPEAWAAARGWLESHTPGRQLLQALQAAGEESQLSGTQLAGAASSTFGALGSAALILIVGVYFAADPSLYRDGVVRLVPPRHRARVREALDACGQAVSCWLLGQSASMAFLGATTAIGLWLLEVPLALVLGLITGLLAFVPFFGSIAAGALAVLIAFIDGPEKALYVALLFLALQQVEEYLLQPLVQRWAVSMPPVLTMFSALVFGVLFGPLGIVFGTPVMVVTMVLVRMLYVEDVLERQ